jgi:hypothetical protein
MFKWKRRLEEKINEKICKINRKNIFLILFLMSFITLCDFYFNGFNFVKLILLELIIVIILVEVVFLKIK